MRTSFWRPQTTAAWTWEALVGVTMTSGLTVVLVNNLGFRTEETRTGVNEGELCVYRSCLGMAEERHWRKPSDEARDGTDA
jgi:hypothetical protein